jgi:hypothetical protein
MIEIHASRADAGYVHDVHNYPVRKASLSEAIRSLVRFELGYGGRVVEISETRIKVITIVLSKIDTTIFIGTKEEMEPLLVAVAVFMDGHKLYGMDRLVNDVMNLTKGKALLVAHASGLIAGGKFVKPATMIALLNNIDHYELLKDAEYDDFLTACELLREGNTIEEVIDLIEFKPVNKYDRILGF